MGPRDGAGPPLCPADETAVTALEVRPVTDAERPAVRSVVRRGYAEFEPFLDPDRWVRMSGNLAAVVATGAEGLLLGSWSGGQLVGTVTYLPPGPRSYAHVPQDWAVIRVLAVDPAARGRGIGRHLVADCLARAAADGVPAVGLHTATMMTAARRLYEGFGFGVIRDFEHLGARFCIYGLDLL